MATVLIIDDSMTIRQAIRFTLKNAALFSEIFEARDGDEGLQKIEENHPDIVICDIIMPKMD
ncbi:MAG: response regulator, partial [Phycisphaerae bacterium]|nr:response regulator [Phycisphaerae bacterium]